MGFWVCRGNNRRRYRRVCWGRSYRRYRNFRCQRLTTNPGRQPGHIVLKICNLRMQGLYFLFVKLVHVFVHQIIVVVLKFFYKLFLLV